MNVSRKRSYHSFSSPSKSMSRLQSKPTLSLLPSAPLLGKTNSLFKIISTNSKLNVKKSLEDSCINVTSHDIEQVLKLSYRFPTQAFEFFCWAGHRINNNHTPHAWNLMIDILGKNGLFATMWDLMKLMRREGVTSRSTFTSIFASYLIAGKIDVAIKTFEAMNHYGCIRNVVSLNSLLRVICSSGRVIEACDYLPIAKKLVRPNSDTYTILMEGFEIKGNVAGAKDNFIQMICEIGLDPTNVPAYDSFLCTLIRGSNGILEAVKFFDTLRENSCYPGCRFFSVALNECARFNDMKRAEFFWEVMLSKTELQPTTEMYNSMITLYCNHDHTDVARKMLDRMVCRGVFPDSLTYNLLFGFLIKDMKLLKAMRMFSEMVKNGFVPDQLNCDAAIRVYLDNNHPTMAIKVWECLVENYHEGLDGIANFLVVGLLDNDKVHEAVKYANHIIERGIKLTSYTFSKLRQSLVKERKEFMYKELVAKRKAASYRSGVHPKKQKINKI